MNSKLIQDEFKQTFLRIDARFCFAKFKAMFHWFLFISVIFFFSFSCVYLKLPLLADKYQTYLWLHRHWKSKFNKIKDV